MGKKDFSDFQERTFKFAVMIIKLVNSLPKNNLVTWVLGRQIINSASSIDSNIDQAKSGVSKADFINHLKIANKEARETKRWLLMLMATELINKDKYRYLTEENEKYMYIGIFDKNARKNSN
jgi:four helix bundle protein